MPRLSPRDVLARQARGPPTAGPLRGRQDQPERLRGALAAAYVFSNLYSNFWLIFGQTLRGSFSAAAAAVDRIIFKN